MRLDKFLTHTGFGSRKEVKEIIKKGYVCVNDKTIKQDKYQIDPDNDVISVDGEIIDYSEFVYIMLNKPAGYISATSDLYNPTVLDLIDDYHKDIAPVGRLDIDTEGLLLLTNDGKLAHSLLSPKKHCPKIYFAKILGEVNDNDVALFKQGIVIDTGYQCMSADLKILSVEDGYSEIEVTVFEGKYHQVKKMFEAVNKKVVYLKRIQMKTLKLYNNLELGESRLLTNEELNSLMNENMIE
jgi:16S rRNA pseudouridine516 synthase